MTRVVEIGFWQKGLLIMVMVIISITGVGYAKNGVMKNELNGFVDLYWGESIEAVKNTRGTQLVTSSNGQVAII